MVRGMHPYYNDTSKKIAHLRVEVKEFRALLLGQEKGLIAVT